MDLSIESIRLKIRTIHLRMRVHWDRIHRGRIQSNPFDPHLYSGFNANGLASKCDPIGVCLFESNHNPNHSTPMGRLFELDAIPLVVFVTHSQSKPFGY